MSAVCKWIGVGSLFLILFVPFIYAAGLVTLASLKLIILLATLAWFGSAPFWIGKRSAKSP
jgi:hypothetical protein